MESVILLDITELFSVYTTQKSKRLDCPHCVQFQVMQFQTYLMFQKLKIEMCTKLLLCDCKQSEKGGRRILLGDNTGGEAVTLRLIRFTCVVVWI
jgi:hypothetical protein